MRGQQSCEERHKVLQHYHSPYSHALHNLWSSVDHIDPSYCALSALLSGACLPRRSSRCLGTARHWAERSGHASTAIVLCMSSYLSDRQLSRRTFGTATTQGQGRLSERSQCHHHCIGASRERCDSRIAHLVVCYRERYTSESRY